jgi:DNA gyrase/topoisomerase IV subunit A
LNHKRLLEDYRNLSKHQQGMQEVIDEKTEELEIIYRQLGKIQEDLLKLKSKQGR